MITPERVLRAMDAFDRDHTPLNTYERMKRARDRGYLIEIFSQFDASLDRVFLEWIVDVMMQNIPNLIELSQGLERVQFYKMLMTLYYPQIVISANGNVTILLNGQVVASKPKRARRKNEIAGD